MNWNFNDLSIAVIGDHSLDIDYVGRYSGLMSREQESLAIFDCEPLSVHYSGGGAANIVEMLRCLDIRKVFPVGLYDTWHDTRSRTLYQIFNENEIWSDCMLNLSYPTPTFIKYYRQSGAHIFRVNVAAQPISDHQESELIRIITTLEGKVDIVIVADYDETGKGVITESVLSAIGELNCTKIGLSRSRIGRMKSFDYLILNLQELNDTVPLYDGIQMAVRDLFLQTLSKNIIVTMESDGATLFKMVLAEKVDGQGHDIVYGNVKETDVLSVPATGKIDTCGCGDAFVAGFAAGIGSGMNEEEAIQLGNAAARAEVQQLYGARAIELEKVKEEYQFLYEKERENEPDEIIVIEQK